MGPPISWNEGGFSARLWLISHPFSPKICTMIINGTAQADRLSPQNDDAQNTFNGLGGNDTIIGGGRATIFGGDGDDSASGGGEASEISGDAGNDTLLGASGDDTIDGGGDHDRLYGGAGRDQVLGGAGFDFLVGYTGGDAMQGQTGNDTFFGMEDDDTLLGGEDDDLIYGGTGADLIEGGAGSDTLYSYGMIDSRTWAWKNPPEVTTENQYYREWAARDTFIDRLYGGAGNDVVIGVNGDFLYGGAGEDTLALRNTSGLQTTGGVMDGGEGFDSAALSMAFDSRAMTATLRADGSIRIAQIALTITACETVQLTTGSGNDRLQGTDVGGDVLATQDGNDTLQGMGGDDLLFGGKGRDVLEGGAGRDRMIGGLGADLLQGGAGNDDMTGDDGIATEDPGADTLEGEAGADSLAGGAGDDRLFGGIGNDTLRGGSSSSNRKLDGADYLDGGAGADLLLGDDDYISERGGDDTLLGGAGNDSIYGRGGDDLIEGGKGNDVIFASYGNDLVSYEHAGGAVKVDLSTGIATGADGRDTLDGVNGVIGSRFDDKLYGYNSTSGHPNSLYGGAGNDLLDGRDGDDLLSGGAGADSLTGGKGRDTLTGDGGNDALRGGGDADVFVFSGAFGSDRIADFDGAAGDVIQISHAGITSFALLKAAARAEGGDLLIDFGTTGTLRLVDVAKADLAADDFVFS